MKSLLRHFGVLFLLAAVVILSVLPPSAFAHVDNSEGYSKLSYDDEGFQYQLSLDILELGRIVDLGIGTNSTTGDFEKALQTNRDKLMEYLQGKISVFNHGVKLEGEIVDTNVDRKTDRDYTNITITFPIESKEPPALQVSYDIFFIDNDPDHRNIVTYDIEGQKGQFVFTADTPNLHLGETSLLNQIVPFVKLGFHHILIGLDHILFIIALVITAKKFTDIVKVLTLFTIAHSVTLGLTALKLLFLPPEIIEPLIALSVAFVAIERFLNISDKYRYSVVFIFGLIHGVGFAGALELSDPITWSSIFPVITFNVGVELGQLLIVLILFPLLFVVRKYKWSLPATYAVNGAIFLIGMTWYFQRFLG